jgi:hypothetical protein
MKPILPLEDTTINSKIIQQLEEAFAQEFELVQHDLASGLGSEHISPALAKACCLLAVDDSFEQTCRKIEAVTGQKVSANTIERLGEHVGSVTLTQQRQSLQEFFERRQIPDSENHPETLYIAVDGTGAHEIVGWHEAKVGAIYWQDEHDKTDVSRFVAGFENSERFGWHLWLAACRCGLRQAKQVIYRGDAAGWIRTEHHRHFWTGDIYYGLVSCQ